jgi:hypothetical protein
MLLLSAAFPAAGQDAALSGLPGVWVKAEISPTLVKDGLAHHQVTSDIETQLKETGVRLLTEKECRSTAGQPKLLVSVMGTKVQENWKFYTFAVNIHLYQDVYLARRDGADSVQASTWQHTIAAHGYIGDIRTRITELIGTFIEDYQAANH